MPNWWEYPVTQAHGVAGEQGVDLGTPQDTPLTALYGGTVQSASYGPWGGLVDILANVPGYGTLHEYLLHLDQIQVQPGQQLAAGQQVGLSGGQLSGGTHNAQQPYSSGPHTEVGFFTGTPFASSAIDPTALVAAGPGGGGAPSSSGAQLTSFDWNTILKPLEGGAFPPLGAFFAAEQAGGAASKAVESTSFGLTALGNAIAGIPTTIGHGLADALVVSEQDLSAWLKRQGVAFFVAALVLLVLFA